MMPKINILLLSFFIISCGGNNRGSGDSTGTGTGTGTGTAIGTGTGQGTGTGAGTGTTGNSGEIPKGTKACSDNGKGLGKEAGSLAFSITRKANKDLSPEGDEDKDGLKNKDEIAAGLDPYSADSDFDGYLDSQEIGSISAPKDGDKDGIIDALENNFADSDLDGKKDHSDAASKPQAPYGRFEPLAIVNDNKNATTFSIRVEGGKKITKVLLTNDTRYRVYVDGKLLKEIQLYDDGSHGDRQAGDNIFSRNNITSSAGLVYASKSLQAVRFPSLKVTDSKGTHVLDLYRGLGGRPPLLMIVSKAAVFKSTKIDANSQKLPFLLNIASPSFESQVRRYISKDYQVSMGTITKEVISKLGDDLNMIYMWPDSPATAGVAGVNRKVSNKVQGIGQKVYNYGKTYGSSGSLISYIALNFNSNGPILHETLHNWAVFLDTSFGFGKTASANYRSHWGYSGTYGQHGGFKESSLKDLGNGQYSVSAFSPIANGGDSIPFSTMELYLMGLVEKEKVPPFTVFQNGTITQKSRYSYTVKASGKTTYKIEDVIAKNGERKPSVKESVKDYKAAFVIISHRLLTDVEMAAFNAQARHFGLCKGDGRLYTFYEATKSRATMNTKLK